MKVCKCLKAWFLKGWTCCCLGADQGTQWQENELVRFGHRSKVYSGKPGDYNSVLVGNVGWHCDRIYVIQEVVKTHKCTCVRILDHRYTEAWAPVTIHQDREPIHLATKVRKRLCDYAAGPTTIHQEGKPMYLASKAQKRVCVYAGHKGDDQKYMS